MALDPLFFFGAIAALIFLGFAGNLVFSHLRFNDTILLIGLGLVLGPVTHVLDPAALATVRVVVGPLALILILFDGGLALKMQDLLHGLGGAAALAIIGYVFSIVGVAFIVALALDLPFMTALILGSILGGTSAMVVLPSLQHMNVSRKTSTILGLESTITSVLVVVGTFALISIVVLGEGPDAQAVASKLLITFALSIAAGVAAGFLWLYVAPQVRDRPYGYMMTLGVVFALYVAVEWILTDVSSGGGPLAVLAFGIVLGNAAGIPAMRRRIGDDFAPGLKRFQGELAFLVRTFFFIYLGILVDLPLLGDASTWAIGVLIVAVLVGTRYFAVAPIAGWRGSETLIMTLMVPRGLAAAVMAAEPASQGVPGTDTFVALGFVAIILTNVFTTVASMVLERRAAAEVAG